jgi:hypothetical protein
VLNLSFGFGGEDLKKLIQGRTNFAFVDEVLEQKQLRFLLIQPFATGVGSRLANGLGEGARENQSGAAPAADAL